ncbi:NAD-dependent epimerase/dehydratase family protein [Atrimonas thermophila]|uniref:NAD-dependent epimerase/dehydratase family protein n=1 Tax=Atrimonas thermophila TaxID=3064161 RepID=UPI00399D1F07
MKVLVSGGAGFIGSHVVDNYLAAGYQVVVVDDLSTGKKANLNPAATFYQVDITDSAALRRVFEEEKPDIINHHAAQINLRRSVEDPTFDAWINILGSLNLIELSRQFQVEKFVFASTGGAIYGEPNVLPVKESAATSPLSPYGVAKRSVEMYLEYYHRVWGLEYVALRYGNVYGPRQDPQGEAGVVAIFCGRILRGKPCVVFGDGRKTRDYVYVEDVARANLLAVFAPSGVYNIGTGRETSVLELVELLEKISGRKVEVVFEKERKGEINHIALSCEKARRILGWVPEVDLWEGLKKTFNFFQGEMQDAGHGS